MLLQEMIATNLSCWPGSTKTPLDATSVVDLFNPFQTELFNLKLFYSGRQPLECISSLAVSMCCCDSCSSKIGSKVAASCRERFPWKARAHSKPLGVTICDTERCILSATCESMVASRATVIMYHTMPR